MLRNFEYKIKPIKTVYAGVTFRSRLEAQWACFFDLMGWGWDYEPIDLNGWSPDFLLIGSDKMEVFVEVKPITSVERLNYPEKYIRPIISSDVPLSNCLLVGITPFATPPNDKHYYPFERYIAIGWIYNQALGDWDEVCFKGSGIGNTSSVLYDLLSNGTSGNWKSFLPESQSGEVMTAWKMAKLETSFLK